MKPVDVLALWSGLLALAVLTGAGCADAAPQHQPADDARVSYQSVWAALFPDTLTNTGPPGSLQGDFHSAARSRTLAQARTAWAAFLAYHDPPDGFYEDAMHARRCEWARIEVQRLAYLAAGDETAATEQFEKMRQMAQE